jgi:hypothetical protein
VLRKKEVIVMKYNVKVKDNQMACLIEAISPFFSDSDKNELDLKWSQIEDSCEFMIPEDARLPSHL